MSKSFFTSSKFLWLVTFFVCFSPFFILGPYSFVQMHDNGDGAMPFSMAFSNDISWGDHWFPYTAAGAPRLAQGITTGYQTFLFRIFPAWVVYQFIILLNVAVMIGSAYLLSRKYLLAERSVAAWGSLAYAFVFLSPGILMGMGAAIAPLTALLFLQYRRKNSWPQQVVLAGVLGGAAGYLGGSFFLISFIFIVPIFWWVVVDEGFQWKTVLASGVFILALLVSLFPELLTLLHYSANSHRVAKPENFNDTVAELTSRNLQNFALYFMGVGLLFWARYNKAQKTLFVLAGLTVVTAVCVPVFKPWVAMIVPSIEGMSFLRLTIAAQHMAFFCGVVFMSAWRADYEKNWHLVGKSVFAVCMVIFIADETRNKVRGWVINGNLERYSMPELAILQKRSGGKIGQFRVDAVNFPLGSGFLPAYELEAAAGYLNMYPNRYKQLFTAAITPEKGEGESYNVTERYMRWGNRLNIQCGVLENNELPIRRCFNMDVLSLLNVTYLFSRNPIQHPYLLNEVSQDRPWTTLSPMEKVWESVRENFGGAAYLYLYKNKESLPRAFLAYAVERVPDAAALTAELTSRNIHTIKETVLALDADMDGLAGNLDLAPGTGGVDGVVFDGDGFKADVTTSTNAVLVVSNSYSTNWKATIDGRPAEVFPAYGALWGVLVPAGSHAVKLSYE